MSLTVDRLGSDACLLIKMPYSMNGTWTTCSSKEGAPIWYRKHCSLPDHSSTSVVCWKGQYLLVKWPTLQAPRMSQRIYMFSQVLELTEPERLFLCISNSPSLLSWYFITANRVNDTCHRQWYKSILWAEMAGGHYRKERCPAEAGGKKLFKALYVFPFIRIYNKMYKVYLTIIPICTDFQNYIPIDTGECLCEISWEHNSL